MLNLKRKADLPGVKIKLMSGATFPGKRASVYKSNLRDMEKDLVTEFTLLYNKYKKPLFNYLAKIVKSEMLAEDIAHNVFIKLYNNLPGIRDVSRIEIWIFTTARNEAFGHFRKDKPGLFEDLKSQEEKLSGCSRSFVYNEFVLQLGREKY